MAALRHAARKLLLHQRPQAPVAVHGRLLHGSTPSSVERTAKILEIQEKVQGKKEELYSLLAQVQRERLYMPTTRFGERQRNLKLLQCLSVYVTPGPGDKMWIHFWITHKLNGVLICGAAATVDHAGHAAVVRAVGRSETGMEDC